MPIDCFGIPYYYVYEYGIPKWKGGGALFPNWKAEMARLGLTYADIGNCLGKSPEWVENRLQGKATLPISAAMSIRNTFFRELSYDYLFSDEPVFPKETE